VQIVSADISGVITSWDASNGHKVLQFSDTHAGASLTAMTVGHGGKRLVTGVSLSAGCDHALRAVIMLCGFVAVLLSHATDARWSGC
jgi:hypothetical protein